MAKRNQFRDKIVWITGASSGIGEACAQALHKRGAKLILSGRNLEALKTLALDLGEAEVLAFDVSDKTEWDKAKQSLIDRSLLPSIVILNAGTCKYFDWPKFDYEMIEEVHQVNFLSTVYGSKIATELLLKTSDSQLAVVSSSSDIFAFTRAEAYGSSKAAISYFVRSLRADLQHEDLSISLIRPGFIKTPLTDKNDFPMPFLISAEQAATRIVRGLEKKKEEMAFPRRFTLILSLISRLPQSFQNYLSKKMVRS